MTPRRFPGPWRVELSEGGHFVIKDANDFPLAYVYARQDEALRNRCLSPTEAITIAQAIAKLPELLRSMKENELL
jgi:hypothetical protein